MNKFILSIFTFVILISSTAQSQQEVYSKVRLYLTDENQIANLMQQGVLIEHFTKSAPNSIDLELSASDLEIITANNVKNEILIKDVKKHFLSSPQNFQNQKSSAPICGLQNFEYGTMGHYHTYDEILSNLDSMVSKYPNIITAKNFIGTSIEGRVIYAVKISDNPYVNERNTEGTVYFDALHHAREPLSMESLLYYMWWLLENYGTDSTATYLIDNRELHFIPVVNPDGYVYNQTTDPMGGGMWRKNRRNSGGGDFGVDLNRNYSSGFGDPTGSSSSPSSGIYHGDSAFSEPESRAVRDYVLVINPSIAFSCHTSGQKFLVSPGCFYPKEDYESYAEFSSEFINNSFLGYGTTFEMLNYSSCGTSRHFMHDNGMYAWVPELGSSFWPPQSEFCSTVQNFLGAMQYISFVSGSYPRLNDFLVSGNGYVNANDTLKIDLRIKNRGISFASDSVSIEVSSLNSNCTAIDSIIFLDSISARSFITGTFKFLVASNVNVLDSILLKITIKEKNFITYTGTKNVSIGSISTLFSDDAESGFTNWTSSTWDTTFMDMQSGIHSIADSRYGNYESYDTRIIELNTPIDMVATIHPRVQFDAKWSLDFFDEVNLEITTNGFTWNSLKTYINHQHWIQNDIDLSNYIGQIISLRFKLTSDGSVQSDGFYFDDFKIVDYTAPIISSVSNSQLNGITIYPNPVKDLIRIRNENNSMLNIELYHCTGKLILSQQTDKNVTTLNLSEYAKGIYFIRVYNRDSSANHKLIKQ